MERLEEKVINGRKYYYYSEWAWVNGKCRRVWQKYLGKLEDIVKAVDGGGPPPKYAVIFQWGLPTALLKECSAANLGSIIDSLCPKRNQGLSTGDYIALASLNRAIRPTSKRSFWEWFSRTSLIRHFPHASRSLLSTQRFWDHMDRIDEKKSRRIWEIIIKGVIKNENIKISQVAYDGTNFYTFIDTFNFDCEIAKRGKNKQGRSNLRQISYALFCSSDEHIPLYYEVYEGNKGDQKQFPLMLEKFHRFFQECSGGDYIPRTTIIFDKGNNSTANFTLLDNLGLHYVGSVKLNEHQDIAQISNKDSLFKDSIDPRLEGTKSFRKKKKAYGRERLLVVTYHDHFFHSQWQTLHSDITKALTKLSAVRQNLHDRAKGLIKGGRKPTTNSVAKKCLDILKRPHMKDIITFTIKKGTQSTKGNPILTYSIDTEALQKLSDTYLGKHILITNREDWTNDQIIRAYRSQYIIEDVFKEMKDRTGGGWWPLYHWTDSKIKVHGLYCTIAVLLRALLMRRLHQAGFQLSMKRVFAQLNDVNEVVNVFPKKRKQKKERTQTVLTQLSEIQKQLLKTLDIEHLK